MQKSQNEQDNNKFDSNDVINYHINLPIIKKKLNETYQKENSSTHQRITEYSSSNKTLSEHTNHLGGN